MPLSPARPPDDRPTARPDVPSPPHAPGSRAGGVQLKTSLFAAAVALAATCWLGDRASAAMLTTVVWAPDGSADGTGTGTLPGSNTVTYTTAVGFNAGTSLGVNWDLPLGTDGAVSDGVTSKTAGVLGGPAGGSVQTITFTQTVVNPVFLANFLNPGDVFDFGPNAITLLDSLNASAAGNVVSATAATDGFDDGFGVMIAGTFGPGTPLVFTYTSDGIGPDGLQSVAFTVGVFTVPEPASLTLVGLAAAGVTARRLRRRS